MECRVINKEEFRDLTLEGLIKTINELPKTSLQDLRYSDLYQPIDRCHGIYIIKSPQDKYYFGKATKRCVADRIGAHFDSREGSYLNSFLKTVACSGCSKSLHQIYEAAVSWEFSVLFVEGNEGDTELAKLIELAERMLIIHYRKQQKCFNGCRRKEQYIGGTLSDIFVKYFNK